MTVDSLFPGLAFRCKEGMYVAIQSPRGLGQFSSNSNWLSVQSNMGWWDDFHEGDKEVIVYLGERRSTTGRLLREVLWRGQVAFVRPYDWRHFEILDNSE